MQQEAMMARLTGRRKACHEPTNLDDGDLPSMAPPSRLNMLHTASGLLLGTFLLAHLFFVASLLISQNAFYTVARLFEGAYHLGKPYPVLVSSVVTIILVIFISHVWLAMRKFPAGYRQHYAANRLKNYPRDDHASLWWLQIWTGLALFFMATIHLYAMLTKPSMSSPFEAAERVWTGNLWPLYLMLLFAAELHASIGLYRLAIKRGWFAAGRPSIDRRRQHLTKHGISAFFVTLGLITLAAYSELGRNHAAHADERYIPTYQSTLPAVDID